VPAFNVGSAVFSGDGSFDFVKDPKASSERLVAFKKDYHQVTDEYHPSWDLSGMVQQAQFTTWAMKWQTTRTAYLEQGRGVRQGQTLRLST
jgi:hypothetical protein